MHVYQICVEVSTEQLDLNVRWNLEISIFEWFMSLRLTRKCHDGITGNPKHVHGKTS